MSRPRNASTPGPKPGSHNRSGLEIHEENAASMRARRKPKLQFRGTQVQDREKWQERRRAYLALEEFAPLRSRRGRPNAPLSRQRMDTVTAPTDGAQRSL